MEQLTYLFDIFFNPFNKKQGILCAEKIYVEDIEDEDVEDEPTVEVEFVPIIEAEPEPEPIIEPVIVKVQNKKTLDINLVELNISVMHKNCVIFGRVQSGKRAYMIQYAIDCFNIGRNCVIITNNITSDLLLMQESFKNILNSYGKNIDDYVVVLHNDKNNIIETLKTSRKIILMLFNVQKIKMIKEIVDELYHNKISTNFIIDEGDISMNSEDAERNKTFDEIKKKYKTASVSATPKSLFFETKNLKGGNIYKIPVPSNYVSTEDIKIITIEDNKDFLYIENLIKDCSEFIFKNNKRNTNKVIGTFINTDRTKGEHNKLAANLNTKYPNSYVVVNDDKEIKIYKYGTFLRTSNQSLPATLYDIQNEWDNTCTHLFLIGSVKISRCTPIRAELPIKPTECNEMLLITNMIYIPSLTAPECNIVQQVRIVGIYPGTKPELKLFTTEFVKKVISKYNKDMDDIIDNYHNNPKETTNINIKPIPKEEYLLKPYKAHKAKRNNNMCYYTNESFENRHKLSTNSSLQNYVQHMDKIFSEWANPSCNSNISLFMKKIKPNTQYTKQDILVILEDALNKEVVTIVDSFIRNCITEHGTKNHGYGIFVKDKDNYSLRLDLVVLYDKYF